MGVQLSKAFGWRVAAHWMVCGKSVHGHGWLPHLDSAAVATRDHEAIVEADCLHDVFATGIDETRSTPRARLFARAVVSTVDAEQVVAGGRGDTVHTNEGATGGHHATLAQLQATDRVPLPDGQKTLHATKIPHAHGLVLGTAHQGEAVTLHAEHAGRVPGDGAHTAAVALAPQFDGVVAPTAHHQWITGAPHLRAGQLDAVHRETVPSPLAHALFGVRIPDAERLIKTTGHDPIAVHLHAQHRVLVPLERAQPLSALCSPEFDGSIVRAAHDVIAAHMQRAHSARVTTHHDSILPAQGLHGVAAPAPSLLGACTVHGMTLPEAGRASVHRRKCAPECVRR
mmetsp:Transcript_37913/g.95285  ORF Transcript_37913/g.95285 Transcript_37913/m.95285 type:complete len:341 (+) Transcript_37913:141-1163(+)